MSSLQEAKQHVLRELKQAMGKEFRPGVDEIITPPDARFGDMSFACFALAKALQKPPTELATEIAAKIAPTGFIERAVAVGPYVNFFLKRGEFADVTIQEIYRAAKEYGRSSVGEQKRIMVEYAQPNTHKEIHVGHLRNFFLGKSITLLLKEIGFSVIPTTYINDLGMHVALCVWGLEQIPEEVQKAAKTQEARVRLMGRAYAEASKQTTEDPAKKEEVSMIYRDLEFQKGSFVSVWKKTRKWSLAYIRSVFEELDLPIDVWYYESDLVRATKHIIEDLVKRGIVVESQGALIVDLEEEGLGANLLVKRDGTLLYNAKDITLALRKQEDHAPLRSLYVIDVRQSLAMQQLFATLKKMGFEKELQHIGYEFVTLKDGAMASRKGNIIRFEEVRDTLRELAFTQTKARHEDWSKKRLQEASEAIATSAMVYGLLRQDSAKKIVFDLKEVVSFEGHTGPYLLYTYSRISSLLAKIPKKFVEPQLTLLDHEAEHRLVRKIAEYPQVVHLSATGYAPAKLCQYLFELCQDFSQFYEVCSVLHEEHLPRAAARAALVGAVRQVLENGFRLIGLPIIQEM